MPRIQFKISNCVCDRINGGHVTDWIKAYDAVVPGNVRLNSTKNATEHLFEQSIIESSKARKVLMRVSHVHEKCVESFYLMKGEVFLYREQDTLCFSWILRQIKKRFIFFLEKINSSTKNEKRLILKFSHCKLYYTFMKWH